MTILTKRMKSEILRRLLNSIEQPRKTALEQVEHVLALDALKSRFGDDVIEQCEKKPSWFPTISRITIESHTLNSLPRYHDYKDKVRSHYRYDRQGVLLPTGSLRLSGTVRVPFAAYSGSFNAADFNGCFDRVHKLFLAHCNLHEEMINLETQIKGVLSSFTTVEKLCEGWPEGYALLPPEMTVAPKDAPLPIVRVADLNSRIEAAKNGGMTP